MAATTRSRTGTVIREPQRLDPAGGDNVLRRRDDKNNSLDDQIKQQRLKLQQQRGGIKQTVTKVQIQQQPRIVTASQSLIAQQRPVLTPNTPTIIRRIRNPDGSTSLVRTAAPRGMTQTIVTPTAVANSAAGGMPPGATKKVFISKDGKVIGTQILQATPQVTAAPGTRLVSPVQMTPPTRPPIQILNQTISGQSIATTPTATVAPTLQPQKLQIVHSADGRVRVGGLLPGQSVMRVPGGKLQILSQPVQQQPQRTPVVPTKPALAPNQTPPSRVVLQQPGGQQTQIVYPGQTSPLRPQGGNQVIATPLAPGSSIPAGMQAFVSGGKTYCIPKASTAMAKTQMTPTTTMIRPPQPVVTPQVQQSPTTASPTIQTPTKQMVEVKPLGNNTVSFKGTQMIVSGPDVQQAEAIAKQLSSGSVKLATLNGKQVLISTTPVAASPNKVVEQKPAAPPIQLPTQPLPPPPEVKQEVKKEVKEEPASPVKQPPQQVTAQFIQTPQGPRIILQGIQCANIPKDQLLSLQQQVKEELLKAQAEAKQHNKVPPTKIAINLPPSLQQYVQMPEVKQEVKTEHPEEGQGDAAVATAPVVTQPTVVQQIQQPIPQSQIQLGQKVIMMNQQKVGIATPIGQVTPQSKPPTSVLLSSLQPQRLPTAPLPQSQLAGSPKIVVSGSAVASPPQLVVRQGGVSLASPLPKGSPQALAAALKNSDKFELTPDYIQSAIQTALKDSNLSPETERKLIALQQHNKDQKTRQDHDGKAKRKKAAIDPETGEVMDDEWDPYGDTKLKSRKKVKPPRVAAPKARSARSDSDTSSPLPPPVAKTLPLPTAPATTAPVASKILSPEENKKQQIQNGLQNMLFRQKEMLKKGVAEKRALQERELQQEIHREIDSLEKHQDKVANNNSDKQVDGHHEARPKRKRHESHEQEQSRKRKRSGSISSSKKDVKLHCICKTKYNPNKFYVGCDVCNEWFHGSCVNITETMSKKMREYVCDECKRAKENQEIYCLCRRPYDETQFYIGCERCSEWYHGRCVGILQSEADKIDGYNCPKCDPDSQLNQPNLKPLTPADNELIKKLVKQLATNRYAMPFKEPVDPNEVPNYYKVVKEPMDLLTIEQRVNQQKYHKLSEFVGDVMRIFENCRFFNQPNSAITKTAECLENFFAQKLALLRDKIVQDDA